MWRTWLTTFSFLIIACWWTFTVLWLPPTVEFVAKLAFLTTPQTLDQTSAAVVRSHALTLATHGTQSTDDIFFTPNEVGHMNDIFRLYRVIVPALNIASAASWIVLIAMVARKQNFILSFQLASKILFGFVVIFITSLLFFKQAFIGFHALLFPQGNWEFPATSIMIQVLPEVFWVYVTAFIALIIGIFAVLYYLLGRGSRER